MAIKLLLCLLVCGLFSIYKADDENLDTFIPTNEWQTVKKGKAIPRGLHVRMNIQTGDTEAKLLESATSETSTKTDVIAIPTDHIEETEEDNYLSPEELKKILGRVGTEGDSASEGSTSNGIKNKYRSYEKLKEEFEELELAVKTDMELIKELILKAEKQLNLKHSNDKNNIIDILTDLEYLVHQIDNAYEFVRLRGLTSVVLPAMNSTIPEVRSQALWLLGSAAQNNPKVQIAVMDETFIPKIIRCAVLDTDDTVRARAIYALSCVLRRFPTAQEKLLKEGGLNALGAILDSDRAEDLKIKVKIITLIYDLVREHQETESAANQLSSERSNSTTELKEDEMFKKLRQQQRGELKEKLRQYRSIGLEKKLVLDGWCSRLPQFLIKLHRETVVGKRTQRREDLGSIFSKEMPLRPEHDVVEKVTRAMLALGSVCKEEFRTYPDFRETLSELITWYKDLGTREELTKANSKQDCNADQCEQDSDDVKGNDDLDYYFSNMAESINKLEKIVGKSRSVHDKEEL